MFVFGELMIMFMTIFYVLQIGRIEQGSLLYDYNDEGDVPSFMWYAFVNEVLLMLGDFSSTHLRRSDRGISTRESQYIYAENILIYVFWLGSVFMG